MYRAIPVGNKACAERVRQRNDEMLKNRIKTMKPQIDNAVPSVAFLDHVRNNLKREQMLEERYHLIDRDNRILLMKMSDIMRHTTHGSVERSKSSPVSLTRDARKAQLNRITQENGSLLKRIQQVQPVYNVVSWEDDYRKSFAYFKNSAEYPPVLKRGGLSKSMSSLAPIPKDDVPRMTQTFAPGEAGAMDPPTHEMRYVVKEGRRIGPQYYLLEMATDGRILAISAYNEEKQTALELVVNEKNHRRLYRDFGGDYSRIAQRLSIEGGLLCLDMADGEEKIKSKAMEPPV